MTAKGRRGLGGAARLAATALALRADLVSAQTLRDAKCTGSADIPWDEQIAGCSSAIESGQFPEKGRAVAFSNRGNAYLAKADLDHAIADYNQAIRLDPDYAFAFNNRGYAYALK